MDRREESTKRVAGSASEEHGEELTMGDDSSRQKVHKQHHEQKKISREMSILQQFGTAGPKGMDSYGDTRSSSTTRGGTKRPRRK